MKRLLEKIRKRRFEKKKLRYFGLELQLRCNGITHIRYTKEGVPLPDWGKMIQEQIAKIKKGESL